MTLPDQSEESRRLEDLVKGMLFDPIDVVFKRFKEYFDNEARLLDKLPLNEKESKKSYVAHYTTEDMIITRFFWVIDNDKKLVCEIQSFKHPFKHSNDTADRHGEEEA